MDHRDHCDPALLELFRAEMDAHVPVLSQGLLALEKGQAGEKELEAMMRAAHSIKGAARIVRIDAAVRVAHAMEDCFSAAQGRRIELRSASVDVLLQGVDALERICLPEPDPAVTDAAIQALLGRIALIRDGAVAAPSAAPPPGRVVAPAAIAARSAEDAVVLPALLDETGAELMRARLSDILSLCPARVRLDFSHVRSVGAAGLALLASVARECMHGDAPVVVEAEGLSAEMAVLLRTTGLDGAIRCSG